MLETVGSTISRLWGTKQSRRAIICVVLMIGSVATPVAVSPVNDADAAPSPDIYIDDDETDPSVNQDLNAGQTYTFDFVIGYEVPEGESAEVQLNFPNLGGDTVTRQVTGTGEVTISVTKTVPKELIGDSLRINAIVNGENINLDVDKEEYSVVAPGDPPEIDSTDPSAENTVVVERAKQGRSR